eukprot:1378884-Rhodomonas_salina.2
MAASRAINGCNLRPVLGRHRSKRSTCSTPVVMPGPTITFISTGRFVRVVVPGTIITLNSTGRFVPAATPGTIINWSLRTGSSE